MLTSTFLSLFPLSGMRPETSKQCTLFSSTPSQKSWTIFSSAANFLLLCLGPSFSYYKTMFPCSSPRPVLHASTPGSLNPPISLRLYVYRSRMKTCSLCANSRKIPLSPHFAYEHSCTRFLKVQPLHNTNGLPLRGYQYFLALLKYTWHNCTAVSKNTEIYHGTESP